MVSRIKKRNGDIVLFDKNKVANAIFAAAKSVGGKDKKRAEELADLVEKTINETYGEDYIPTVEEIQDIVEKVLIENGHAKTAKAYIIYRKEKERIREEKKAILNKDALDEIDKKFSVNALRVLASRYLIRDDKGNIIESPKELFMRVAINLTLPEILYDERVYDKDGNHEIPLEDLENYKKNIDKWDKVIKIGKYTLTKYHVLRFIEAFERFANKGKMKITFSRLINMLINGEFNSYEKFADEIYDLLIAQDFMPNTPALVNSGRRLGMLSACFTLDVDDDMESIMKLAHDVAMVQKAGGGTGMNFSKLRPEGDVVQSTMGAASGPLSFMEMINAVTNVIKQGGVRRGANMGILEVWHPDIEKFIVAKLDESKFTNFNISVGLWDDFWKALEENKEYPLVNPRTEKVVKYVDPEEIFDMIASSAWRCADPGVLFFDNINKYNVLAPARNGEPIRITNPCGEEPLYPYESCNLASINIANFVVEKDGKPEFDWERFRKVTRIVTRSLDNTIDVNKLPLPEIAQRTREMRRIGLGIMGMADALFKLGIKYNSEEGYKFMSQIMENLTYYAYVESIELAKERGTFDLYDKTDYTKGKLPIAGFYDKNSWTLDWDKLIESILKYGVRNAMVTTSPPTGSVSMIADTSNGVEPIFSLVYEKRVTVGTFFYVDRVFEKELKKRGLYNERLLKKIADNYGSLQGIEEIPDELKKVFVTSMDIHWLDHILAQAVMQKWVTDSISKTINMPKYVTVDDVKQAYIFAYLTGCKGTTIYRDESKSQQVLVVNSDVKNKIKAEPSEYALKTLENVLKDHNALKKYFSIVNPKEKMEVKIKVDDDPVDPPKLVHDKCPICGGKVVFEAGCERCVECGWSACVVS